MEGKLASPPSLRYFAYGSNMCTGRLVQRVPSARPIFVARLPGYGLRFHKRSVDGSGKADAFETGQDSDAVWGVVFEINPDEKPDLDRAEGLGNGYEAKSISVFDKEGTEHSMFAYLASTSHIDPSLRPYSWYKRFVVEGARQHSLPEDYIAGLASHPLVEDPDRARDARNRKVGC